MQTTLSNIPSEKQNIADLTINLPSRPSITFCSTGFYFADLAPVSVLKLVTAGGARENLAALHLVYAVAACSHPKVSLLESSTNVKLFKYKQQSWPLSTLQGLKTIY